MNRKEFVNTLRRHAEAHERFATAQNNRPWSEERELVVGQHSYAAKVLRDIADEIEQT